MTVPAASSPGPRLLGDMFGELRGQPAALTRAERAALRRIEEDIAVEESLARFLAPLEDLRRTWCATRDPGLGAARLLAQGAAVRDAVMVEMHRRQSAFWAWDESVWVELATGRPRSDLRIRMHLVALGHLAGDHRRLHDRAQASRLKCVADLVFGFDAVRPAIDQVTASLTRWRNMPAHAHQSLAPAIVDILLSRGSPHLSDVTDALLRQLVDEYREENRKNRRQFVFKVSRVLADLGITPRALHSNEDKRGPQAATMATVPQEWLEWALRWRKLSTHAPGTIRTMFSTILIAGRWAAEKHPEALRPDLWTRDIAAEYAADTFHAVVGQWAGHNRNRTRWGQELTAVGKAQRIDSIRSFFCDLIEWEWIKPRFDPRRVLSLPLSLRAQMGPNPRIIDDASWAKLMAAGLTLTSDDLLAYGTPRARASGWHRNYYPIEMVRTLVGVWLFAGLRADEIARLELDCVLWDHATDETTGEDFRIWLLRIPANKTSGPFNKPVDPIVGELIEVWQALRPPQPNLPDRKTGLPRQHLFCFRAQLVGKAYLNNKILPILCNKAGIPESDSRGALTSHRARATIATQLLNAREPLSIADLQQWLGHKHHASTRHYAAILQRTLTAAYRKADYFARNVRTIQVLIDRDAILTGAAAGGEQPWKYYDLGDGYCSYDFFAKCPHRLACARCPFYVPKDSTRGQLLAVKDGIQQMLEQLSLTDDEREALEGDRDVVAALIERLADVPTPAGPTPAQIGYEAAFIPLTALTQAPQPQADDSGGS